MAKKGSPDDANPGGKRSAAPFVPRTTSIKALSAASHDCRGCDLYKTATQVVFGAGPRSLVADLKVVAKALRSDR